MNPMEAKALTKAVVTLLMVSIGRLVQIPTRLILAHSVRVMVLLDPLMITRNGRMVQMMWRFYSVSQEPTMYGSMRVIFVG